MPKKGKQGRNRQSEKEKIVRQFDERLERNFKDCGIIDRYFRHRCGKRMVYLVGGSTCEKCGMTTEMVEDHLQKQKRGKHNDR